MLLCRKGTRYPGVLFSNKLMKTIQVLLVDDHAMVRAGIRTLVERLPSVQVVGEVSDGREALNQIRELKPDIVLMDIAMAELNGLEATARATKEYPTTRIIMLSMHTHEEYVVRALRAGAKGYLLKDASSSELKTAFDAVLRGETYLSHSISRQKVDQMLHQKSAEIEPLAQLTPRQREILQLIAEGKNTKEIAYLLNVSVKTVETHRAQLMDRLQIHDVAGLVRYAMRAGLITPES